MRSADSSLTHSSTVKSSDQKATVGCTSICTSVMTHIRRCLTMSKAATPCMVIRRAKLSWKYISNALGVSRYSGVMSDAVGV